MRRFARALCALITLALFVAYLLGAANTWAVFWALMALAAAMFLDDPTSAVEKEFLDQ